MRAFEVVARHVSYTKAADELCVTHGAVRRHIGLLEDWLGTPLFRGSAAQLTLTEAGQRYLAEVGPSLARIANASAHLNAARAQTVRVNAPPTFSMRWFIPRMSSFQRRYGDVEIELTASTAPVDLEWQAYDVAVRGTPQPGVGDDSIRFMTIDLAPVCHVRLLEQGGLVNPEQLTRQTWITYQREPVSWTDWLARAGLGHLRPANVLPFEQMSFALQAAADGLGLVLVPLSLVADEIVAGRMCAPFGRLGAIEWAYHAHLPAHRREDPLITRFGEWLVREGRETERLLEGGAERRAPGR
ncbi:LysR substrate-binding domain-containing protein [Piscinibacter koreensis]|uniref:LysR family transcriptional regulator n=1 Tax=Piscinibacter koreensis TaxID=2742824 RepID=A0A7Y6TYB5_9BURK|nr:LysR family transcriptional regulator [Schlegelella koreensis]